MNVRDALPYAHRAAATQYHELAKVVGRTSTIASTVILVQPTTVASLPQ